MVKCQECGTENKDESKYCQECGCELKDKSTYEAICTKCGMENLENAKHCTNCGASLKTEGYNTTVTIGLLGLFFCLPVAFICGGYLWTRPEAFAKEKGKWLLIFATAFVIVILIVTSYF